MTKKIITKMLSEVAVLAGLLLMVLVLGCLVKFDTTRYAVDRLIQTSVPGDIDESELTSADRVRAVNTPAAGDFERLFGTLLLWGAIGLVAYYIVFGFELVFIRPVRGDREEARYINASKTAIRKKRILWIVTFIITIILCVLLVWQFKAVLLNYTSSVNASTGLKMYIVSMIACAILVRLIRVCLRILVRAY